MTEVGDATNGFSITHDETMRTLHVTGWGFWSVDVASQFGPLIVTECTTHACQSIVFDLGRLAPMREEGQQGWSKLMSSLAGRIDEITVGTRSKLTKLQLLRLSKAASGKFNIRWTELEEEEGARDIRR
jgi:hypothetical protein